MNPLKNKYKNAFLTVDLNNGHGEYRFTYQIGYAEKFAYIVFILGILLVMLNVFSNSTGKILRVEIE